MLIGGTVAGQGNVISGNAKAGVALFCGEFIGGPSSTRIQGNLVGTIGAGFHLPARVVDTASTLGRTVGFFVLSVLTAIVLGFLSPDFGPT